MKNVVIAGYARSPFTFAQKGELVKVRPDELAAQVIRALIERSGVNPEDIEDLILGCAFPEGEQGLNMARLVGFLAELPLSVAGATVNRFCGSSMYAIHMAAGAIRMEAGELFICAGVESMTRVPMMGFNPMPHPGLAERYPQAYISMGETAEKVARRYQITRDQQEAFAVSSQAKAAEAQGKGRFDDEIVAIKQNGSLIEKDGCLRPGTKMEDLASLKPAFDAQGSVSLEQVVDGLICDCCQTDVTMTAAGPLAAYRNRNENEIRDIYVAHAQDGAWQAGQPLGDDNWEIAACPVNGPALAANKDKVAIAWFTGVGDIPKVLMATSADSGRSFSEPVEIATGNNFGHVGIALLEDGATAVSWLRKSSDYKAELVLTTVSKTGAIGNEIGIGADEPISGYSVPQLSRYGDNLLVAWTAGSYEDSHVRTALVPLSLLK